MRPADTNSIEMNTHEPDRKLSLLLRFALVLAVFCKPSTTHAQNLVANPGFEETDSCTFGLGLGALHYWYSAFGTPDHLQGCQPYGTANGLPLNIFTFQQPYEGTSCVGIFTYDGQTGTEYREWIMVPLSDTLTPGQTYYVSFRANAAFNGNGMNPQNWLASNHLGLLLTTYDRYWVWGDDYPVALEQAHVQIPQILSDTVGWTLVSGSLVADSAYTYLMIGNFFSNALTDTLHFASAVPEWGQYSYALVDAVCLSPNPGGCDFGQSVGQIGEATSFVYPNPAGNLLVIGDASGRSATVVDILGQEMWNSSINHERFALDVESWARGAYVLHVRSKKGVQVVKFVLAE